MMEYEELMYRIYDNGMETYFDADGKRHHSKGWARKESDGSKFWYIHGKLHREDGPAVEFADGDIVYYLNGKRLTKKEWKHALRPVKEMTVKEIAEALGHEVKVKND